MQPCFREREREKGTVRKSEQTTFRHLINHLPNRKYYQFPVMYSNKLIINATKIVYVKKCTFINKEIQIIISDTISLQYIVFVL